MYATKSFTAGQQVEVKSGDLTGQTVIVVNWWENTGMGDDGWRLGNAQDHMKVEALLMMPPSDIHLFEWMSGDFLYVKDSSDLGHLVHTSLL